MARVARKWMCAILAAMLLAAALAPAALAAGYSAYFSCNANVYAKPSTSSASMSVKKGTTCSILAVVDNCALVQRAGVNAYCDVRNLTLSSRIRGYVQKEAKLYASASTSARSVTLAVNTEVYIVGRAGDYWRVQNSSGSITGYIKMSSVGGSKVAVSSPSSWKDKVVLMDWYKGGSSVLARGEYGRIYDIATGITINVKRMGGTNHADLEPATADDTLKLLKIAGGTFSWDSIPVILYANGKYVAAAINTLPHGDQTITDNGYDGQFCLHMVNSRTHGSDTVNEEHQKAIAKAYSWAAN
ncbi:MAG: hypothetical protein ACI4MF_12785 [Candidatus Faecivicinus sp.]